MALKERKQQLMLAAEMLQVHLPALLSAGDQELSRDALCVFAQALRTAAEDVETSAEELEQRASQDKADDLRREWRWTEYAIRYAESLVKSENTLDVSHAERISWLIPIELAPPTRHKFKDREKLRGACRANRSSRTSRSPARTSPPASKSTTKTASKGASKGAPEGAPKGTPKGASKGTSKGASKGASKRAVPATSQPRRTSPRAPRKNSGRSSAGRSRA